jgi:uncharacterized damage-inducible protein DinB
LADEKERLRQHYRQTREDLLAAIEGLSDETLTKRSLDGWSVKDHLVHIAVWDEVRANEVERISAGHASVWRMSPELDEAYNAMAYELREGLSLEQARWELAASRKQLLSAISSATQRGLDPSLYGEAGLVSGHEAQHTGWIKRWRSANGL